MKEDLDDGEFWLPSQFLTEEDILTDFDISNPTTDSTNGFNSDLGSLVDSVTETESDEEELLAELARQMALSSLLPESATANPKGWVLSGSPQSILCPVGGVRRNDDGSSRGSPTGPVSPPAASSKGDYFKVPDAASFDLIHAAAGEVAKMRMRTEQQQKGTGYFESNRGLLFPPRKQTSRVSLPAPLKINIDKPAFHGFFSHQSELSHQQLQGLQFQQLWSQETMKQHSKGAMWGQVKPSGHVISRSNNGEEFFRGGRSNNHLQSLPLGLSPSDWPPLQHPSSRQLQPPASAHNLPGSGMRALFLGTPGSKGESVGTGVFLPRRVNPTESRKNSKKPACSTVLLPEKVVKALNNINAQSQFQTRLDANGRFGGHNNGFHGPRRKSDNASSQPGVNPGIQLPSEWTY